MADERPAKDLEKIMVRLPDGMRDRLNALSKANGRSANAEVVFALEAWIDQAEHAQQSAHEVANDLPVPTRVLGTYYVHVDADGRVSKRVLVSEVEAIEEETGTHAVDIRMITITPRQEAADPRKAADAAAVRRSRDLARGKDENR